MYIVIGLSVLNLENSIMYLHTTVRCKVRNLTTGKIRKEPVNIQIRRCTIGKYHGIVQLPGSKSHYLLNPACNVCENGNYRIVAGTITHINEKVYPDDFKV